MVRSENKAAKMVWTRTNNVNRKTSKTNIQQGFCRNKKDRIDEEILKKKGIDNEIRERQLKED